MNEQPISYLNFSTSPIWFLFSLLVLIAGLAGCFWNWYRSGFRRSVLGLETLRAGIFLLVIFVLNQPEWTQEFRPLERPRLIVLIDESVSMETRDVERTLGGHSELVKRTEVVSPLSNSEGWTLLKQRFDVQIRGFSSAQGRTATDIAAALEQILQSDGRVQGVVMISDGDTNRGTTPVDTAMKFRARNIPIFTIPVGSQSRMPDIELTSLDTPTFGVVNKSIRIPFTIDSSLPRNHSVTVTIETSDGEKQTKEVRLPAMSKSTEFVNWTPKEPGDYTIRVDVPHHPDELIRDNNSMTVPIAIRKETLRVLVIETSPRWEYRYLRNALSRDPGVEVACLLMHPELGKLGGGNRDYIKEFPSEPEELGKYDVVFLGDIGVGNNQLTEEQCKFIRGIVEYQASGLVFLPGPQGNQNSLVTTPLEPLLPVVLDPSQPLGVGSKVPMLFDLTESGRRSLLTKLAETEEENIDVWGNLPGFQWYAPVERAKAGSEVLSVHHDRSNQYGRIPLITTKTFGAGKVLYMATDGAWRWRRGVEDKYHYRFWGQVVRWMAYQRNMAKGESIRFYYSPEQPNLGQTLSMRANILSSTGEPLSSGEVSVKIDAPSGATDIMLLESAGVDSWGLFEGRYKTFEAGLHHVLISNAESGQKLETSFFVQGTIAERVGRPSKPRVLEELSKVSRGEMAPLDQIDRLQQRIVNVPEEPLSVRRWQIWAHPVTMSIITLALTLFWVGRKWVGLI